MTTTLAPTPLSAVDRCDRCGAQAYVRVRLAGGRELLFCGHHSKQFGPGLRKVAVEIHDETARLDAVPPTAPTEER